MKNNLFGLLLCSLSFLICIPLFGQENDASNAGLVDFDFGVAQLETNYAGFPTKVTEADRAEYEALKTRCRQDVSAKGRKPQDALAELYAWFGDFHLRVGGYSESYMQLRGDSESVAQVADYYPEKSYGKVTEHTFFIRFPSCAGDDPTPEWVQESVAAYQASGCENLIIDIRGNGGGLDTFYKPYLQLLYDRKGYVDGVEIRNTPEHAAYLEEYGKETEYEEMCEFAKEMEASKEQFLPLTPRKFELVYDSISPLPHRAALIIDRNVASSGEQMVLELRACSGRTAVYGAENTMGCLDYSNARNVNLPVCGNTIYVPMTRSCRLPDWSVDEKGIAPDVHIPLPPPDELTDEVDEWVRWVARQLEAEEVNMSK